MSGCATTAVYKQEVPKIPLYRQEFEIASSVSGITINIIATGWWWSVDVKNDTDETIKFLIDESSFVTTKGRAERLIRGQTRKIHSDTPQPSIPIPPEARYQGMLTLESWTSLSSGYKLMHPLPTVGNFNALAKFYLVFEIDGEKKTWITNVKFIEIKQE